MSIKELSINSQLVHKNSQIQSPVDKEEFDLAP